jgi:hypothetical protein
MAGCCRNQFQNDRQEEGRQENRRKADQPPEPAVGCRYHDRAEIGGKGERRFRHRLRRAIAGKKGVVVDPARWHDGRLQERQHDVAAAEHQRAGAVEPVEQCEKVASGCNNLERQSDQDAEEQGDRGNRPPSPDPHR